MWQRDRWLTHEGMKRLVVAWVMVLAAVAASAQERLNALVSHYTTAQGLPHQMVSCSIETRDGFSWFGTWYGLARFDGAAFRTLTGPYLHASDPAPRKVETLVEDSCGNLWIKTLDWKLSVLFKRKLYFKSVFDELKPFSTNLQVIKIQADGHGGVLLLTKDKNLLLGTTDRGGNVHLKLLVDARAYVNRYNYRLARPVVQMRNGRVSYVGTAYQISSVPVSTHPHRSMADWQQFFHQREAKGQVFTDRSGGEWKPVGDDRLEYYNPATQLRKLLQLTYKGRIIEPTLCDAGANGIFYLSPAGEAVRIDRQTLQVENIGRDPRMADAHLDSHYMSMRMGRDGTIWLTSANSGVWRITFLPRQFRVIPLPISVNAGIKAMYQFANGEVWVGSRDKNLYVLSANGELLRTYDYARYGIGSVYHIMADHKGRIWLSTKGDGLVMAVRDAASPGGYRFVHYRHQAGNLSSISGDAVYMTYEDSKHRIWVCTLDGGLNLMDERDGRTVFWHKNHGMKRYPGFGLYMEVRNLVEDNRGRIWVGTIDGLMSFSGQFSRVSDIAFETYRKADVPTLTNSDIYALHKDRQGHIWVCAFGGGVNQIVGYDAQEHRPLFREVGDNRNMRGTVIATMQQDGRGVLWMGNDQGVTAWRPNGSLMSFDQSDGFPDIEMEEASSVSNQNGELWMGTRQGILAFRPDRLRSSDTPSNIYIVSATVNNQTIYAVKPAILSQSVSYADTLRLRHNQSMFTLEFAAPNYRNQSHLTWRYRLEGYETHWHYGTVNRIASYTQVPPGEYRFVVEAGSISSPKAIGSRTMTIIILPPWWATWWARTIYVILFAIAVYFAVRYARYQVKLKNDVYIQSRIAAFKKSFYMEQQDQQFVERARQVVESNLTRSDFDVDAFAAQMGMSHSALFKRIKQLTGSSPLDYIRDIKLAHALELLKSTVMSVGDVAYQSGFSDAGYFGKCFRKKYGMSPREFQRSQADRKV